MTKRIILCANTAWNIANFRQGLINSLMAAGFEVHAVAPHDAAVEKLKSWGCVFHDMPMDNKGTSISSDIKLLFRMRKLLAQVRPSAYLGFTIKPNVYGSLAAQSLGIATINNISGLGTAFIKKSILTMIVKVLYRIALARSHTVFFQNKDDLELFVQSKLVRKSKTALLPGSGINLDRYAYASAPQNELPVFLLVARLLRDKGVLEFVDAARQVNKTKQRAQFQLLGYLDSLNRTAITQADVDEWVRDGIVSYLGTSEDVRPVMANADCVVLPSYREGTPRTLLEAAALGRPLIATDVPGCRDVVDHGKNGFLCQVRNSADLAKRFEQFIETSKDDREAMGKASRRLVEESYSEDVVINCYQEAVAKATGEAL